MGRRGNRRSADAPPDTHWESERTMAAAEEEAALEARTEGAGAEASTACPCGSREFLLEAYLHVVDGRPRPEPVEVEHLTCPGCGREFEAIVAEDGRILRGEFVGYVETED